MELKSLTSGDLILLHASYSKKEDVIRALCERLKKAGKISSVQNFYHDVMEREKLSATGIESDLAIPHGKSEAADEPSFAVALLDRPITDWPSIDPDNRVNMIFLLAIPEKEAGTTHLKLLAELSKRLSNSDYRKRLFTAEDVTDFLNHLDDYDRKINNQRSDTNRPLVLAVTACPAGIAHTYMAAQSLENAGASLGVRVRVEKQGANGIEDPFKADELAQARAVILAHDVQLKHVNRFDGMTVIDTSVAAPLKNSEKLIKQALDQSKQTVRPSSKVNPEPIHRTEEKQSVGNEIKQAVLTGISYIVPIIIAGGMIQAISLFIAQIFNMNDLYNTAGTFLNLLHSLGSGMLGTLMVPVLAAYVSYSISDKPGLAPGFAAGLAASLINTGFVGGLAGGFIAGYLMKWMKKHIKTSGVFSGFVTFWVYPVLGTLLVSILMFLIVGKPIVLLNNYLVDWLKGLSGSNAIILGVVLGAMVSFDLGGPVNKAAYAFCIGAMADGNIVPYAAFASVKMVSAFTVTACTVLFKKYFDNDEREVGKSTWILGLAGITEGAIPFMLKDPVRVVASLIAGSAITGAIVAYVGVGLPVPGAGIFSVFFLKGPALAEGIFVWIGAALLGTVVSTVLLLILRALKYKNHAEKNKVGA
ncbi:MAG: PTS 2-O-a-mannosyl-D-glycerate transporter subunit IIABC [Sporolactobacillus sp.]|jgi:2-O-A-mannosyl-D-glycerate-specific PTS system IIC component|nr:PTS 2-O-a-mannosyl-D-glycerate transporter subunit IIABC [Sporolactobacillus sp.]